MVVIWNIIPEKRAEIRVAILVHKRTERNVVKKIVCNGRNIVSNLKANR